MNTPMNVPVEEILRVLVADDEPELRAAIRSQLKPRGFQLEEAADGGRAWEMIQANEYDLVLLDVRMPIMDGLEVLRRIRDQKPATTVAMITAHANVNDAVQAIHNGAFDYVEKPLKPERLDQLVDRACEARRLVQQIALSRPVEAGIEGAAQPPVDFVGHSQPMQRIFKLIDRLANVNTSVLIRGENGTGKELVARAIHYNSPRKNKPFVALNCGAIPESLMESELFGHEKGSFTGATQRKIGKFQFASGGTLFLDEIGELPLQMQVKLLRVLQDRRITPVGSNRDMSVDVRIIAATNRDLEKMIEENRFRQDLFYRLNVMSLELPPLRERQDDIPLLVKHFIEKFNTQHKRSVKTLSPAALQVLKSYSWPGNIRELENAIEHAFVLEAGQELLAESLPEHVREEALDRQEGWELPSQLPPDGRDGVAATMTFSLDYNKDKERFEREFIIQALKSNGGRINQTCEQAHIPKNTLLRKMRKYGITSKDYE